jgi:hypothetical protein
MKELRFRVSRSYGPGRYDEEYEQRGLDYPIAYVRWTEQRNMEAAMELQARGRISLADLVESVVPVDDAADAFARLTAPASDRPTGAIVLEYDIELPPKAEQHPEVDRKAPAQPSRAPALGLIGPGDFARQVLIPAFVDAGARLELVAGGGGPSAERAVREIGFGRYAASADELIADPLVDVVVIASRHARVLREAASTH